MTKERFTEILRELGFKNDLIETMWESRPPQAESMTEEELRDTAVSFESKRRKRDDVDESLKRATEEMAEKISDSAVFVALFNEKMIEEVAPLIQMGLAVYMDKPIYLLVPAQSLDKVPENLKKMARRIETYDPTLPDGLRESALQAATLRLLEDQIPK